MNKAIFSGFVIVFALSLSISSVSAEPLAPGFAWAEQLGWIHLSVGGDETAQAEHDYLSGFFWAESIGWVHLGDCPEDGFHYTNDSASDYGINRDGIELSGYAWGENVGWIDFSPPGEPPVVLYPDGTFEGAAWSESAGWIVFFLARPRGELTPSIIQSPEAGMAGEEVTLRYQVENTGEADISGEWTDGIFISQLGPDDENFDMRNSLLLERNVHTGGLAGLESYEVEERLRLPGMLPGPYHLIVVTDMYNDIDEGEEGEDDNLVSPEPLLLDIPEITLGEPVNGSFNQKETEYWYKLQTEAAESVEVALTASCEDGKNAVYVRYNDIPTPGAFDAFSGDAEGPNAVCDIGWTQAGTYYILAKAEDVPEGGCEFSITGNLTTLTLRNITPDQGGTGGEVTTTVWGTGFDETLSLKLQGNGMELPPDAFSVASRTQANATFDLAGAASGIYHLYAEKAGGVNFTLAEAFEVVPTAIGPRLEAKLDLPPTYRPGREGVLWIEYENTGDADMLSPLFIVSSPGKVPMRLTRTADDEFETEPVHVLGINPEGDAGVLPPGVSNKIPVYFMGTSGRINFNLEVLRADKTPVDWSSIEADIRPPNADSESWDPMWQALTGQIGTTWRDYLQVLSDNATRFSRRNQRTWSAEELFSFEVDKAYGRPTSAISGTVRDKENGRPVSDTFVVCREMEGEGYGRGTLTGGKFVIDGLSPGMYEIFIEDYYWAEPVTVEVSPGRDATGLKLSASPIEAPGEIPEREVPDFDPQLVTGDGGEVHLTWRRGAEFWHAVFDGESWDLAPSGGITGSSSASAWGYSQEGLPGKGIVLVWESGAGNERGIYASAVLREPSGRAIWTEPMEISAGKAASANPCVAVLENGSLLFAWLKRNWEVTDDTDLYWALLKGFKGNTWEMPEPGRVGKERATKGCCTFQLAKGTALPSFIPVIGGRYGFEVTGEACATFGCSPALSGALAGKVDFTDEVSGMASMSLSANWRTDRETCAYVFDRARLSGSIGASGDIPAFIFTFPGVEIQAGAHLGGTVGGAIEWRGANFPSKPTGGQLTLGVEVGPYGTAEFLGGLGEAEIKGIGAIEGKYGASGFSISEYNITLSAEVCGLWGSVCKEWSKCWGVGCEKKFKGLAGKHGFKNGVHTVEKLTKGKQAFEGTGSVYSGNAVLADVSEDLLHDGRPRIVCGPGGETLLVWRKDSNPEDVFGSSVVVSSFSGSNWDAPAEIVPPGSFNRDPALVFAEEGQPFLLWSHASADGITMESSAEEILDAASVNDLFFSKRVGNEWSPPEQLCSLEGSDNNLCAASDGQGTIVVAWIHDDTLGKRVFAAVWRGSNWSSPEPLTMKGGSQKPTCAFVNGSPLVAWAQDTDGKLETCEDVSIYFSTWDQEWTAPEELPKETPSRAGNPKTGTKFGCSFTLDSSPEEDCCECPEDDPDCDEEPDDPEPPDSDDPDDPGGDQTDDEDAGGSDEVRSVDPNEKHGPPGFGEQHVVTSGEELTYTIFFENRSNATAPAQEVFVVDQLDPDLDWSTFRVREIAFGDRILAVTEDTDYYYKRVDIDPWVVDIEVSVDQDTGEMLCVFRTLDPETGLIPLDPESGFLPPNCDTENPDCDCSMDPDEIDPECKDGRGEAHLTFTISPKAGLPLGTVITNFASITFDFEEPIITNTVSNTIGELPPEVPGSPAPADRRLNVNTASPLNWADSERAQTYDLYLWKDGEGRPDVPVASDLQGSCYTPESVFAYETTYHWQVVAGGRFGDAEGPEWTFTTGSAPPLLPGEVSGPDPASGAVEVPLQAALTWSDAENVHSYAVFLWPADQEKPDVPSAAGLEENAFLPASEFDPGTTYNWQVVAWNVSGQTEGPIWSFTTVPGTVNIYTGDVNGDGKVDISDPITVLGYLFQEQKRPLCLKAADTNNDQGVDISDVIVVLGYLFQGTTMTAPDNTPVNPETAGCHPYALEDIEGVPAPACEVPCTPVK